MARWWKPTCLDEPLPILLLLVAVLALDSAVILYPQRHFIRRPQPLMLWVTLDDPAGRQSLQKIRVTSSPEPGLPHATRLTFRLEAQAYAYWQDEDERDSGYRHDAVSGSVELGLGLRGRAVRCFPGPCHLGKGYVPAPLAQEQHTVLIRIPRYAADDENDPGGTTAGTDYWYGECGVVVQGVDTGLSADGVNALGQLPHWGFRAPKGKPHLDWSVPFDDARSYIWSDGAEPVLTTDRSVSWTLDADTTGAINGENKIAAQAESDRIFFAGALLGVAGGAFVAAVEAFAGMRRRAGGGRQRQSRPPVAAG